LTAAAKTKAATATEAELKLKLKLTTRFYNGDNMLQGNCFWPKSKMFLHLKTRPEIQLEHKLLHSKKQTGTFV